MIFYNFEDYFGKRHKQEEEEESFGPDTSYRFDHRKYMWLLMVHRLIEELNYKEKEVYEMNYISALNWLSMFSQKDKYIDSLNRQQMAKNKF